MPILVQPRKNPPNLDFSVESAIIACIVTLLLAAGTYYPCEGSKTGRLDFSDKSAIMASNNTSSLAAGRKLSQPPEHTGRLFFFDVPTPFEVQRKTSGKTR